MRARSALSVAALLATTIGVVAAVPATAATRPVLPAAANPVAGQYTVVLDDGADVDAAIKRLTKGATVTRVYRTALRGFTVRVDAARAKKIAADSAVTVVQQDSRVHATDVTAATAEAIPAPPATYWGLNRIDQRTLPPNAAGTYNYYFSAPAVTAYVIDTGINYSHTEFGGRATLGVDLVGDGFSPPGGDCYGHGTHVAGTIGGTTYGVAKSVKLKSVRVLDCGGGASYSTVIAGLDWVAANAAKPAVVNLSLGGGVDQATNIALNNMIESGVTAVVAAGNSADDACNYSPASTLAAITVGATGDRFNPSAPITDARSDYSNYGPCLDIFAPGSEIKSAWIGSTTATNTISGTSMATPHVAGVAALYLSSAPTATATQVRNYLVAMSTAGAVADPGPGSPNRMLYAGGQASLSLNASPEPVTKGARLVTSGTLTLAGRALAGKSVEIWFDQAGATLPVKMGTVTTTSTGSYTRTQTAVADGYWYSRYLSQPLILGRTSVADYVDCSNC